MSLSKTLAVPWMKEYPHTEILYEKEKKKERILSFIHLCWKLGR